MENRQSGFVPNWQLDGIFCLLTIGYLTFVTGKFLSIAVLSLHCTRDYTLDDVFLAGQIEDDDR